MKKKHKFYTVWIGRKPGVYASWDECKQQIYGFENAVYKSFNTLEFALEAFKNSSHKYIGVDLDKPTLSTEQLNLIGNPHENRICVDGACNTISKIIEYQGLKFPETKLIFHAGPFNEGTNNIAEFLAIVHALAYCKNNSLNSAIYSDSQTAISWVQRKKANTKIEITDATNHILSIIHRAENWLNQNKYENLILKWQTSAWGENPADFGRK